MFPSIAALFIQKKLNLLNGTLAKQKIKLYLALAVPALYLLNLDF